MTSLDTQLWELIENHKMPADASGTSFTRQLMRDNAISEETAKVAVTEYKKFKYLCATRSARNVPSKAVDLVWHLHMQHSRDYWDVFCKTLGKPVHHTPGGHEARHLDDYNATVAAYRALFGVPPRGIWRQHSKADTLITMILLAAFMAAFGTAATNVENPTFSALFLLIPLYGFVTSIKGLTAGVAFTLVFECTDPFADEDGGHCGSGGCAGCGD